MVLPLQGLRVVDLTKNFAGPFCTLILSDLGAEVIKVEKPVQGDETRSWGPPFIDGVSYYFLSLNRGKKSIVLNLKTREAQMIVRQLVRDADIFVESFRPGTLSQYGLDYRSLRRVNKALVYCSISGFGQTGPYRDRPGYDLVAFAMSGIMSTTGEEGRPSIRVSVPVADIAAGHYSATAILACVSRRLVTGRGDYIDISLLDSIVSWLSYNATYYFATGTEPPRMGSAHPSIVPYQAFKCKDRELVVAVGNDQQWKALCKAVDLEQLSEDSRFATNPKRVRNRKILIPILAKRLGKNTAAQLHRKLLRARVPSTPVYRVANVARDVHLRQRKMIVKSARGPLQLALPFKFTQKSAAKTGTSPRLGQDTSKILKELGYSAAAIENLRSKGILSIAG